MLSRYPRELDASYMSLSLTPKCLMLLRGICNRMFAKKREKATLGY